MPVYTYSAADKSGRVKKTSSFASSEYALERKLDGEGQLLVDVLKVDKTTTRSGLNYKLKKTDLIEMAFHLSIMTTSGIPILKGLQDYQEQRAGYYLKKILKEVLEDVNSGLLLSEALEKHPNSFGNVFINLVRAGEASGSLDIVMERYYKNAEWESQTRSRLLQALAYPSFLIMALTGLVVLLLTFLLPKVMGFLSTENIELPLPTKILIFASEQLQSNWIILLGLAASIPIAIKFLRYSDRGKYLTDLGLMKLPVVGPIVKDVAVARFISTLQTLLTSGVELIKALEVAGSASGNQVIINRISAMIDSITRGSLLSQAFEKVKEFNSLILNLIQMSEKTGQTTFALERIVGYFDTVIPRKVKKLIGVMEPSITICAGLLVGFVLVGTLLPIFNLYSAL